LLRFLVPLDITLIIYYNDIVINDDLHVPKRNVKRHFFIAIHFFWEQSMQ